MTRVLLRSINHDDMAFVLDSWLLSFADSNYLNRPHQAALPREQFFSAHRIYVQSILGRKDTHVILSVNKEEPTLIYGYLVFEHGPEEGSPRILHYVYVKRAFSRFGIATGLLHSLPFNIEGAFVTHLTHKGKKAFAKYNFNYSFCFPYAIETNKGLGQ